MDKVKHEVVVRVPEEKKQRLSNDRKYCETKYCEDYYAE